MIFGVVKKALGISPIPDGALRGYQVNLSAAVAWAAREARLQDPDKEDLAIIFVHALRFTEKQHNFFAQPVGYQIKASVPYLCRGSVSFIS